MMNQYFLNRKDYSYELYKTHGLSNEKYLAAPKDNGGTRYIIKSAGRDCACNEFMGLHLSKLMGVNVPDARLMLPKHGDKYEVAIEFIASDTLPDYERIRHNASLQSEYVYCLLAHCLLEDNDSCDLLYSAGHLYTCDFAEGCHTDDFSIMVMENKNTYGRLISSEQLTRFMLPEIEYSPCTLAFYEMLVDDLKICSKEFFDAALADICQRFLAIPDSKIKELLDALTKIYPPELATHYGHFIEEIRKFCRE